jgi:hypothetical protein
VSTSRTCARRRGGPRWTTPWPRWRSTRPTSSTSTLTSSPGGQQQRLLIARALLLQVKLLVADEIISMLDASTRVDVLNLLVDLKRKGLGILFITHDLSLGNYISDKAVILRAGAVVEMGETPQVFGNPQHSYTKSLLGAVPQLHRKWDGLGAEARPAPTARAPMARAPMAANSTPGDGANRPSSTGSSAPARPAGGALRPGHGGRALPPGPGPRISLMDMPDAAWRRRTRTPRPRPESVLAASRHPRARGVGEGPFRGGRDRGLTKTRKVGTRFDDIRSAWS